MESFIEILVAGFKKFFAEIIAGLLLSFCFWKFPKLRFWLPKYRENQLLKNNEIIKQDEETREKTTSENEEAERKAREEAIRLEEERKKQEIINQYNFGKQRFENKDYENAFSPLMSAAENGHIEAQFYLGTIFYKGYGTGVDYKKAAYWFNKSAENGNIHAQYSLGVLFNVAYNDYANAVFWYSKAAENGFPDAQYNLGFMYEKGFGVIQNYETAYMWYYLAELSGNNNASEKLKELEKKTLFSKPKISPIQADNAKNIAFNKFDEIKNKSKIETPKNILEIKDAQKEFTQQTQVQPEKQKIEVWEEKITNPKAQFDLGVKYENDKNYDKAIFWFTKSAEQGYVPAQNKLADIYEGKCFEGFEKNYEKAVYWRYKASENENEIKRKAQENFELGLKEFGKSKYQKALEFYLKAAEAGHSEAQRKIGDIYCRRYVDEDGDDVGFSNSEVTQNFQKARQWYLKSAEQGNVYAQISLGYMYYYGRGVKENNETAYMWFYLATLCGNISVSEMYDVYLDSDEEERAEKEARKKYDEIQKLIKK